MQMVFQTVLDWCGEKRNGKANSFSKRVWLWWSRENSERKFVLIRGQTKGQHLWTFELNWFKEITLARMIFPLRFDLIGTSRGFLILTSAQPPQGYRLLSYTFEFTLMSVGGLIRMIFTVVSDHSGACSLITHQLADSFDMLQERSIMGYVLAFALWRRETGKHVLRFPQRTEQPFVGSAQHGVDVCRKRCSLTAAGKDGGVLFIDGLERWFMKGARFK